MAGLFFIHRYRFLSIKQFARASGVQYAHAVQTLLAFERQRFLGHFGNTGVRGYGKTPKVYCPSADVAPTLETVREWALSGEADGILEKAIAGAKRQRRKA